MDTRKEEHELHLLGGNTVYRHMHRKYWKPSRTNIRKMIIGFILTVRNLPVCARLLASRILLPSTLTIFPM